jgi:hypothetical protein
MSAPGDTLQATIQTLAKALMEKSTADVPFQ